MPPPTAKRPTGIPGRGRNRNPAPARNPRPWQPKRTPERTVMTPHELSAVELSGLIREREMSATEVMRHFLQRIDMHNPRVNALVSLAPDQALAGAAEVDRRLAR